MQGFKDSYSFPTLTKIAFQENILVFYIYLNNITIFEALQYLGLHSITNLPWWGWWLWESKTREWETFLVRVWLNSLFLGNSYAAFFLCTKKILIKLMNARQAQECIERNKEICPWTQPKENLFGRNSPTISGYSWWKKRWIFIHDIHLNIHPCPPLHDSHGHEFGHWSGGHIWSRILTEISFFLPMVYFLYVFHFRTGIRCFYFVF